MSLSIFSIVALEDNNNFCLSEIPSHLDGIIFKSSKLTTLFIKRTVNLFSPRTIILFFSGYPNEERGKNNPIYPLPGDRRIELVCWKVDKVTTTTIDPKRLWENRPKVVSEKFRRRVVDTHGHRHTQIHICVYSLRLTPSKWRHGEVHDAVKLPELHKLLAPGRSKPQELNKVINCELGQSLLLWVPQARHL